MNTLPNGRVSALEQTRFLTVVFLPDMNYMDEKEWDDNIFPLAYLITFRCYGTWLHGDERNSIDTHKGKNLYGSPKISHNSNLKKLMQNKMKQSAFLLNKKQQEAVEVAIKGICEHRNYLLQAINVRTNHVHVVVSASTKPEPIINAFKSYSTRKLRELDLLSSEISPWSRGGSRRYLWKQRHVDLAINYVLYCQEDIPFEIED